MIFSAKNVKLRLTTDATDDIHLLANQCTLNIQTSLEAKYDAGSRHSIDYRASNGIGSRLNFSHYLEGDNVNTVKNLLTTQGELIGDDGRSNEGKVVQGSFGGMEFVSGYLTSYSIQFSPNSPVIANSEIVFFDDLNGAFEQTEETADKDEILNCKNIIFGNSSSSDVGVIDNFIGATYNYTSEINPVYHAGSTVPERIYFGRKTVSMNIDIDNPTGTLPYNGASAKFNINLTKHNSPTPVESFVCFGRIQSRTVGASVGGRVTHQIGIVSNTPRGGNTRVLGITPTDRPRLISKAIPGIPTPRLSE